MGTVKYLTLFAIIAIFALHYICSHPVPVSHTAGDQAG